MLYDLIPKLYDILDVLWEAMSKNVGKAGCENFSSRILDSVYRIFRFLWDLNPVNSRFSPKNKDGYFYIYHN